jgi:preprotein translocase subunit SecE
MKRLLAYISGSKAELKKVVWPTRRTALRLTIVVIVFSLVMAFFLGAIDYLLAQLAQTVLLKGR